MTKTRKPGRKTFRHISGYSEFELGSEPKDIRRLGQIVQAYREEYYDYTWAELTRCSGVGGTTIKNLEHGNTKSPHYTTVMDLLWALGFRSTATHEAHTKTKKTSLRRVA